MSRRIYDNWERLVTAVSRREQLRELCHAPSISSHESSDSDISFEFPDPSSWNRQDFSYLSDGEESVISVEDSTSPLQQVRNSQDIYVNDNLLDMDQLFILKTCSNPPTKLRPGSYWYDRNSGFWGKQGNKPCQVISVKLDVGGFLDPNASSGNTSVFINDREITEVELRMLKMIGVNCRRNKHFWMYEGHLHSENRMLILNIWNKPGMKLLCSLLSFPYPSSSKFTHHASRELSESGSGTTSFKQFMKLQSNKPVEGYYRRGKEIIRNASL